MTRLVNAGYLFKAPPRNEKLKTKFAVQWRWRWFKLWSNKEFHYYEDFSCNKRKGTIKLNRVDISDIKYPLALPKHPWVISINVEEENREYLLAAADEQSLLKWAEALKSVLKIDYIKVSEIASTNRRAVSCGEDSTSYIKVLEVDRDRIPSYNSSAHSSIDPTQFEIPTNRESRVGPYEIFDPELERKLAAKSDSNGSLDSESDVYVPMDSHDLGNIDVMPSKIVEEDPINLKDLEKKLTTLERKKQPTPHDGLGDIDNESDNSNEVFEPKVSDNAEVYEAMSPSLNTEDTAHDLDQTENAMLGADQTENTMMGREYTEEPNDPIPAIRIDKYDHLDSYTNMMSQKAKKQIKPPSCDYDDILITEEVIENYRQGRAHTVDINDPPEQPIRPPKGSGLDVIEELRRGDVGKFQNLLENYWVMHIYLPNRTVAKELINLEAPVQVLVEKLARLFGQQNNLHTFSIYVLSDIHQTYDIIRKADKDVGKGERRLNHNMSFIEQGVSTAKFLQLVSIKDIDKALYEEYLLEKAEMKLTQEFCETWVPFVKGYFSIPDLREVANLSGYIHFIYQTIYGMKSISHEIFLPRNTREIDECVKKAREQSLQLKGTNLKEACTKFLERIAIWPTANTIAFPIKRVEKTNLRTRYTEILIVYAKDHIGIVKAEKNIDYGNFMYWWHKHDICEFEVNHKDILVIKLTKPFDEGSCEFQIKSSMNKILNQLLENFKSAKKKMAKHNSMGNISLVLARKPHSDLFVKNPLDNND